MRKVLRNWLAQHHDSTLLQRIDGYAQQLHYAYENLNYNCEQNGERTVLRRLQEQDIVSFNTLFDVGANVGDWSTIAAEFYPQARIHAFEPVREAYSKLRQQVDDKPNIIPVNLGLSDKQGEQSFYCIPDAEGLSTCMNGFIERFYGSIPLEKLYPVSTGDRYCEEEDIEVIDFLKIDAEGSDCLVLAGFDGMFREGRIRIVQFEYGYASIETKFLLKDFYEFFLARDMMVGKIYPSYVDFREYSYQDENFIGPNYLAVQKELQPLVRALSV